MFQNPDSKSPQFMEIFVNDHVSYANGMYMSHESEHFWQHHSFVNRILLLLLKAKMMEILKNLQSAFMGNP
ncbi:CLUMA_CG008607, isoform A [Clunio marinus]|uniref:CLUMA_CG008607, isoform A n=1 Tax=Clunio marinus TaxID=568069 RepID=A0A1J1I9L9_9DIPT|nr:CLUMA_CG008607, isoform A [Clunio marinus]